MNMNAILISLTLLAALSRPFAVAAARDNEGTDGELHTNVNASPGAPLAKTGPSADLAKVCSLAKNTSFCVKSLQGDPKSKGADLRQLAVVAANQAHDKAAEVIDQIDQLLQSEESLSDEVDKAFNDCSDEYSDALSLLEDAIDAVTTGAGAQGYGTPLASAMLDATSCDQELKGANALAQLGGRTGAFINLLRNAMAVHEAMQDDKSSKH